MHLEYCEQIQGTAGHHGAKAKGCQRHSFTRVVLHNMLRAHQGRAPTPSNDVAALQNEQVVYVPIDNYRNHSREVKHQGDQLKDYFNQVGALA